MNARGLRFVTKRIKRQEMGKILIVGGLLVGGILLTKKLIEVPRPNAPRS